MCEDLGKRKEFEGLLSFTGNFFEGTEKSGQWLSSFLKVRLDDSE